MHVIYPVVGIEWIDGMVFVSNASVAGCAFRACIPNKYRVMHWCYSFSDQPTNFKQRSFQIKPRFATKLFFFNYILHRSFETINLFFFYLLLSLLPSLYNPTFREFFSTTRPRIAQPPTLFQETFIKPMNFR